MAYEIPVLNQPFIATADLSAKQYYFVKLDTSNVGQVVICAALTDVPIGVLQNKPEAGEDANVMSIGVSKISSDAALSIGNLIGPSGDGQADARTIGTDTTHYVVGQVIEASAAAAGLVTAAINCMAPVRAA